MPEAIRIKGLDELRDGLHDVADDLPDAVEEMADKLASEVLRKARPGVPTRKGTAKGSMRKRKVGRSVTVEGTARHYGWLDFGGRVGRRGSVRRPYKKRGRYIWFWYFRLDRQGDVEDRMDDAFRDVVEQNGIEVT